MLNVLSSICGSCAVSGISSLATHRNPREAMVAFCQHELGDRGLATLTPNYVFVAGPEIPGMGHSSIAGWYKYGTEFAAFIVKNSLGKVSTCGPVYNTKYHQDTTCQVWLWQPDQAAMVAWWVTNNPAKPTRTWTGTKDNGPF